MKFLLMIPLRRCGSNAIRLRMNLHPDFYSPYPLHLCDLLKDNRRQYEDTEMGHFQMVMDLVGLQRNSLIPWENIVFNPITIYEKVKHLPKSFYPIYWQMLSIAGYQKGAKVVMDKCQDSVCDFEELVKIIPDIIFLDIVRDPRAQISSMNDAIIYDFHTVLNTQRWIKARQWSDTIREKYPNKILTIRYEDFIQKNQETMETICYFTGIPFDPIILDVEKSTEALMMSSLSPLWETNDQKPIHECIDKYRNKLTYSEIEHIETQTLEWMSYYNYCPITQHQTPLYYNIKQIQKINQEKQREAWDKLQFQHPFDYIIRTRRLEYLQSIKQ